jgi:hypothetical protein
MGDGLNERSGRFWTWLAGRLRADLSTCSKRGLCCREPAGMASVTGLVDQWRRRHEVSILIAAVHLADRFDQKSSFRTGVLVR